MNTAPNPFTALAVILAEQKSVDAIFDVSGVYDFDFNQVGLGDVPDHHRSIELGGGLHHSFTHLQQVVGGGEALLGHIYTVLGAEGETVAVYYSVA